MYQILHNTKFFAGRAYSLMKHSDKPTSNDYITSYKCYSKDNLKREQLYFVSQVCTFGIQTTEKL